VVGAEETGWLLADALRRFDRQAVPGEGAGALYLGTRREESLGVELERVTELRPFGGRHSAAEAARRVRIELSACASGELLCDSRRGSGRTDAAEREAWNDWSGARLSPKRVLGEGLAASAAWQCVAACDALQQARYPAANVNVVGPNRQAIGARFVRCQA